MKDVIKILRFLDDAAHEIRFRRPLFALAILAAIGSGMLGAAMVALINRALNSDGPPGQDLVWKFVGLCLFIVALRFGSGLLLHNLVNRARTCIELELCQRVVAAPLRRIEQIGSHRIFATLATDVSTITSSLSNLPLWLRQATTVYGCLLYMALLSWRFFLGILAFMALGIVIYRLPMRLARKRFLKSREMADEVFRHLRSLTEGIKELKIHRGRRHAFGYGKLRPALQERSRHQIVARVILLTAGSWGLLFSSLILGVLVFALPTLWKLEHEVVSGYVLAFLYLINPFNTLMNQSQGVAVVSVAVEKIEKLGLLLRKDIETDSPFEKGSAAAEKRAWSRLDLRGVSHTYSREDGASFQLGPLDLTIERGECIFMVGGNGSGKTTLAKLLIGLYRPEQGEIRLDGKPILDHNLEDYRQLFSVVFNDFHLFEGLLGLDRAELDEQAREYLEMLQLEKKVEIREGILSTTKLSQGQRKRLALLTAYLEDRSIYVFDEWAADQDPYFKKTFYDQLLPDLRRRGKTLVVISHDDRYYDRADRLVKLSDGRLERDEKTAALQGDVVDLFLERSRRA
jgi:putative pyoverdin transport system ATP-binding/permease protein